MFYIFTLKYICAPCVFHLGCTRINSVICFNCPQNASFRELLGWSNKNTQVSITFSCTKYSTVTIKTVFSIYSKVVKSFLKKKPLSKTLKLLLKIGDGSKKSSAWHGIYWGYGRKMGVVGWRPTHPHGFPFTSLTDLWFSKEPVHTAEVENHWTTE